MSKILLVEDDNNLREIYGARLIAEGYEIISAHDGEEALALAIKERPNLILTDIMMPKISGFDMIDILGSTTETKEIKIIIMTALSQPEDQKRGEQLGADRYLVKSQVTLEDVVKAVRDVLGNKPTPTPPAPAQNPVPVPARPAPAPPQPAPQAPPARPQATSQFTPPAPAQNPVPVPAPQPAPQSAPQTPPPPQPEQPQKQGGNRVIQPLNDGAKEPSFQELVERELSKESEQAATQPDPQPEAPQDPPQPPASNPAS